MKGLSIAGILAMLILLIFLIISDPAAWSRPIILALIAQFGTGLFVYGLILTGR